MSASDAHLLMRLWLRAPLRIATAAPSGRRVCDALTADALATTHGWVVELGAGTGPVTATLLAGGLAPARLLAIEANERLFACLQQRFAPVMLARHDACDLTPLFAERHVMRIAAVISTLPILNMHAAAQRAVLDACFERALPNMRFTQITYLPGSPVRQRALERWGYRADRFRRVARNWPPATLWQYRPDVGL